jgi:large subunit ribosomal protein L22
MSKPKWEKNYEAVSEAKLRHARMSARKARLVCELIRGKSVGDAINTLIVTHKPSAAPEVLQVLKSARANAENNHKVRNVDDLVVSDVFVDAASMMKRTKAAPMGRAVRIRKRTCHITIRLNEA